MAISTSDSSLVASTSSLPVASPPAKLEGNDWWESIGKPKYVVAPMVDQSELAWRILSRLHGATLAYTPMFHALLFSSTEQPRYAQEQFDTSALSLEGKAPYDRPLVVQFCANDKDAWLRAASKVVGHCDAVDLNLGCPQGIAKKGKYGAFLMDEWELIGDMITHLHIKLPIPVIAKTRVFPSLDRTLAYASHLRAAGAQLLTIHGRTREAKGHQAGLASWEKIAAVVASQSGIPVLANGGVPSAEEVDTCLESTGAVGVMSAEGNLYNPMIFAPSNVGGGKVYGRCLPVEMQDALRACDDELEGSWAEDAAYGPSTWLAAQYLAIVRTLPSTRTSSSAIKSHLFKLFRPVWATGRHLDLREALGKAGAGKATQDQRTEEYAKVVVEMLQRLKADVAEGLLPPNSFRPLTHAEVVKDFGGVIPYSHAQPYFRIAPDEPVAAPSIADRKRALSEDSASSPKPSEKKARFDPTSVPVASVVTTPCVRSTATPPCGNASAGRCAFSACITCCLLLSEDDAVEGSVCEFHEGKRIKTKEKRDAKKAGGKTRRAEAKAKRTSNLKEQEGEAQEEASL